MKAFANGIQALCGTGGGVHVRAWGELHTLCPEDTGRLLFVGEQVPLFSKGPENAVKDARSGPVSPSRSERAVTIAGGSQRSMLPRDRFPPVAPTEEISCIFVEVPPGTREREIQPVSPGGVTP